MRPEGLCQRKIPIGNRTCDLPVFSAVPPPPSAEVKERLEMYFYSPSGPSWAVLGWTLPFDSVMPNFLWILVTTSTGWHADRHGCRCITSFGVERNQHCKASHPRREFTVAAKTTNLKDTASFKSSTPSVDSHCTEQGREAITVRLNNLCKPRLVYLCFAAPIAGPCANS